MLIPPKLATVISSTPGESVAPTHTQGLYTRMSGDLSSPAWNAGWLEVTGTDYVNITCKLKSYLGMASIDLQEGKVCLRVPGTGGN